MFDFGKHAPDARCGLIIDVGSASVAAAIVVSEIDEPCPTVVWTHVERMNVHKEGDVQAQAKAVATMLLNISLEIGSSGIGALARHDAKLRITDTRVAIGAPWTYTVPQQVRMHRDEPFVVTEKVINQLEAQAEAAMVQKYGALPVFDSLGLTQLSSKTAYYEANGYRISNPLRQDVYTLLLVQQISICQKQLYESICELHDSLTPRSSLEISSLMDNMYAALAPQLVANTTYGLIDISGDATEIGIVCDSSLTNSFSVSWGYHAVVRELANITQQPTSAAYTWIQDFSESKIATLPSNQAREWRTVLQNFSQKLADAFARAATVGELPTHYILHSDTTMRSFSQYIVRRAIANMSVTAASVALLSEKLHDHVAIDETRLALSVALFHTHAQ